jgi:predicted secreted protein
MAVDTNVAAAVGDGSVLRFQVGTEAVATTVTTSVTTQDIGLVQSISPSISHDVIDVTALDSGGIKQYIAGLRDASLTFDLEVDHDNTLHNNLIAAAAAGTLKAFAVIPLDSAGAVPAQASYTGSGYVTDASMSMPTGDKQTMSVTVQVTGGLTANIT